MRARRCDEGGFTLVELLVTMLLASIVGSIIMSIVVTSTRTSQRQQDQTRTLTTAKIAMERMTRDIRGANSMTYAAPRKLTFVTGAGADRRVTSFEVVTAGSTSEIVQTVTTPTATTTQKVLRNLAVGRSEAIFSYTDGGGIALTPLTASPTTYAPGDVKTIGVRVRMSRAQDAPPIELFQLVSIRNLES